MINWDTKMLCLIGNPIDNSLSPLIHNYIFKRKENNSIYLAFNVDELKLKDTILAFKNLNIKGFNVTLPYKEKIFKYLTNFNEEIQLVGAVNTVKIEGNEIIGTNTDGKGFVKTFKDNNIQLKDKNILVLGAGGAARGIIYELIKESPKLIHIKNRNEIKAIKIKEDMEKLNNKVEIKTSQLDDTIKKKDFNILINTTSVGMYPFLEGSLIKLDGFPKDLIVYDIIYKPLETSLIKEAKSRGMLTINGLHMLVNQAVLSQEFWFGYKIEEEIISDLIGKLDKELEVK